MRYRAEACHLESEELAEDLLHWESRRDAATACERHARTPLQWQLRHAGLWEAQSERYWYRIVATSR
jgi:hypothetical protein